jgi:uncharacterized protein (DUF58 family)
VSKFTYARMLAAALAYLMLKQQDAVGLVAFAEGPLKEIPARTRSVQLGGLLREMAALSAESGTEVARGLTGVPEKLRRRGLVVFLSDCLAEPSEITETMRLFRTRGHEVVVFHVLSVEERDFPLRGLVEFVDAETGERMTSQASDVAEAYREALAEHVGAIRRGLGDMNIDFVELGNDDRLDRALVDYLARRRRMR